MVSLEKKYCYLTRVNESVKLSAFQNLLLNNKIVYPTGNALSESDTLFLNIITSIQKNDRASFETFLSKKNKSRPNKDSPAPFVNDDFLIFILLIGISKYNLDTDWIKYILSIRNPNPITNTLKNIQNEDFYSKSSIPEITLIYFKLVSPDLITNDFLNTAYRSISENTILFDGKSDFQILCAIHSFDLIILHKLAPESKEIIQLQLFQSRFKRKTALLSWLVQLAIFSVFLYGLFKLPIYSPALVDLINKFGYMFTILGALGFTFLGSKIELIKRKSHELTMQIFGYPRSLLDKSQDTATTKLLQ